MQGLQIDQQAVVRLLLDTIQFGGQYALPTAGLLRALYSGWQGKFPEGAWQIASASLVAGLTAVADPATLSAPNVAQAVIGQLAGNALFTAGLLGFIMTYLFRQTQNMSRWVDGIVGAVAGFVVWLIWTFVLGQWAWWMVFIAVPAGAAALIALRAAMFVIQTVVNVAKWMLRFALVVMLGGGILLVVWLVTTYVMPMMATS
ncbi:MAG: hypothetical protein U0694_05415 [Anaerolineae bacterium]